MKNENRDFLESIIDDRHKYLNQDIINHLNTIDDDINKELQKIDDQYDNEIESFELMEAKNIELLENIHREFDEEKEGALEVEKKNLITEGLKSNKFRTLDSKLIMTMIPGLKNIHDHDDKLLHTINVGEIILSDKKIIKIENLDIYQKLKELYLQRNYIERIQGLTYNINLQVLNLGGNYIKKIENINHLTELKILNLGDNVIDTFDINELPEGLIYLYLFDNIFFDKLDLLTYRSTCIKKLSNLQRLDGLDIAAKEKTLLLNVKNIEKNLMAQRQLDYVTKFYTDLRYDRRGVLNDHMVNLDGASIEDSLAYEGLKSDIDILKQKSKDRTKSFVDLSDERMDSLKRRLEDLRNKIKENSDIFDNSKFDGIKDKLRKAFKLDVDITSDDFLKDLK
jgi:hypothetical protein